ncbi:MAG: IclR family transcriptional regulator [Chloroflexi bacterium]|nr:IclR family transcriptional regulator [Chloroflexota bacterium]
MSDSADRDSDQVAVHGAQAIRRALAVLRTVAAAPGGVTAALVTQRVDLPRTTAIRLLKALEAEGLVRADTATGYVIGSGVLELAGQYLSRLDVRRVALPALWQLANGTRETVNLAIQDGLQSVCIEQIESPHAIRAVNWIGRRLPVHATAIGKAWLASQPPTVIDDVLARLTDAAGRLPAFTEHTIVDSAALLQELDQARRRGYAVTREELEPWLNAVAAPIFGHDGTVAATLVVSGPSFRLNARRIGELGARTLAAAAETSAALGYRPSEQSGTQAKTGNHQSQS